MGKDRNVQRNRRQEDEPNTRDKTSRTAEEPALLLSDKGIQKISWLDKETF
ncbi:MAG: hypothetical protein JST42_29020, partial [Bacteroidetes bacterium]|nr:hypothetical protein [Bacteroidota bacterium]